ncbi:hypothetical protein F5Y11DRAFT_344131 [Daldinia sp. FL1419]|nr:hypothetical protein F5Y11DRAFT_344131 [Daldinia sp. FL1419]
MPNCYANKPHNSGANAMPRNKGIFMLDIDSDAETRSRSSALTSECLSDHSTDFPTEPSLPRSSARYMNLSALCSSHPPSPDFKYRERGLSNATTNSTTTNASILEILEEAEFAMSRMHAPLQVSTQQPSLHAQSRHEEIKTESSPAKGRKYSASLMTAQTCLSADQLIFHGAGGGGRGSQQHKQGRLELWLNGGDSNGLMHINDNNRGFNMKTDRKTNGNNNGTTHGLAGGASPGTINRMPEGTSKKPINGTTHGVAGNTASGIAGRNGSEYERTPALHQEERRILFKKGRGIHLWKKEVSHNLVANPRRRLKALTTPVTSVSTKTDRNTGTGRFEMADHPCGSVRSGRVISTSATAAPSSPVQMESDEKGDQGSVRGAP